MNYDDQTALKVSKIIKYFWRFLLISFLVF
jgi:hypothetical protein